MNGQITFEQPLNEKCRTLLRLSHLFEQFDFHSPRDNAWHARAAFSALLDIAAILARADIKSELLKEMERYRVSLSRVADTPGIDHDRLHRILQQLHDSQQAIRGLKGQLGARLRKSEFLNSVLQRNSIPGGGFDFDLPQFHYWLCQPHAERLSQFTAWRNEVTAVYEAVELVLSLIRTSTDARPRQAVQGFYQQTLPAGAAIQMVQVSLPCDSGLYAEISGGKHRFSIRFLDTVDWEHPAPTERDITFRLNVCII